MPDKTIDEAIAQNLEALVKGDFGRVMGDLSPEAMMAMASGGGGMQMGATFTGYEILSQTKDGDDYVFVVELKGDAPLKLEARWREMMDAWKIAGVTPLA